MLFEQVVHPDQPPGGGADNPNLPRSDGRHLARPGNAGQIAGPNCERQCGKVLLIWRGGGTNDADSRLAATLRRDIDPDAVLHPLAHDLSTDKNDRGMWLKYGACPKSPLVSASYEVFAQREDFLTKTVDKPRRAGL